MRDFLMQRPSDDIDIATTAEVAHIQKLFPKTVPIGVAFGILIVVEEGHSFEVATFRKDRGYVDGRRPTGVDPAAPEEDAKRRDFTINGMFYDPIRGQLYDFVGGQRDIQKGIIRAIGNPHERFAEDRLRMMRAVRYSTRFGFPIEPETLQAILVHATELLPAVAMERVWQEFRKMSQFAHFDAGLITLHRLQLLPTIFPSLRDTPLEEIQKRLRAIPHFPKDAPAICELLELFPSASLAEWLAVCEQLRLSNEEKLFVTHYHKVMHLIHDQEVEPIVWAHIYAHPSTDVCLRILAAHLAPDAREAFLDLHEQRCAGLAQAILRIQAKTPLLRAEDLVQEGIKPSKKMGLLLQEAERLSVNLGIEDRALLLQALRASPLWEEGDHQLKSRS